MKIGDFGLATTAADGSSQGHVVCHIDDDYDDVSDDNDNNDNDDDDDDCGRCVTRRILRATLQ